MNTPVQNGQLPQGFCPPDFQTMLNGFSAVQFVVLPSITGLVVASTPPADHTVAWLQLDSFGRPVRVYFFAQGAWLSQHPLPPGFTMLWNQVLPDFTTFDGGDNHTAPWAALSGQMWQLCSTTLDGLGTQVLAAQFPIGVGTTPAPPVGTGTVIGVGAAGGEELHKLTTPELAPHTHPPFGTDLGFLDAVSSGGNASTLGGTAEISRTATGVGGGDPASGTPPTAALGHNNVPPYYGVYFLQRTNRLFYVVNP